MTSTLVPKRYNPRNEELIVFEIPEGWEILSFPYNSMMIFPDSYSLVVNPTNKTITFKHKEYIAKNFTPLEGFVE